MFANGTIPPDVTSFAELQHYVMHYNVTDKSDAAMLPKVVWDAIPSTENISVSEEAAALFAHMKIMIDPSCTVDKSLFWYRQPDGRCNWLKDGQSHIGSTSYPRSRDWDQTSYADGISKPREGPNPREVSNAFFKVRVSVNFRGRS